MHTYLQSIYQMYNNAIHLRPNIYNIVIYMCLEIPFTLSKITGIFKSQYEVLQHSRSSVQVVLILQLMSSTGFLIFGKISLTSKLYL